MSPRVSIGLVHLLVTAAEMVIILFFLRALAVRFADSEFGKAVAWLS